MGKFLVDGERIMDVVITLNFSFYFCELICADWSDIFLVRSFFSAPSWKKPPLGEQC